MDFPALKPEARVLDKAQVAETGAYGVHDVMTNGFVSVRSQMCTPHPLEQSEKNFKLNAQKMRMTFLRSTQGIHAPLRLIQEKNAVKKINRLPFLPSSNIALETLEGRDEYLDLDDHIFNDPYEGVESLASPHMVMEKYLFSQN